MRTQRSQMLCNLKSTRIKKLSITEWYTHTQQLHILLSLPLNLDTVVKVHITYSRRMFTDLSGHNQKTTAWGPERPERSFIQKYNRKLNHVAPQKLTGGFLWSNFWLLTGSQLSDFSIAIMWCGFLELMRSLTVQCKTMWWWPSWERCWRIWVLILLQ